MKKELAQLAQVVCHGLESIPTDRDQNELITRVRNKLKNCQLQWGLYQYLSHYKRKMEWRLSGKEVDHQRNYFAESLPNGLIIRVNTHNRAVDFYLSNRHEARTTAHEFGQDGESREMSDGEMEELYSLLEPVAAVFIRSLYSFCQCFIDDLYSHVKIG